jgi:hypothetical protein
MDLTKCAIILFCCLSLHSFAGYKWQKASDCFETIPAQVDKNIPSSEIEEGCFYMLVDIQYNLINSQSYFHYAYKLTSENGVQNNSEIRIEYNPAYQKLFLNSIRVYRKGKYIDYSSKLKIKELQREEDLDSHLYDESMTVYIILEDIQIGDIIDYSFTREGYNPIFENFIYKSCSYQLTYTLLDFSLRIIKPNDLNLFIKNHNSEIKPERKHSKFGDELIWKMRNIPGLKIEDYTPSWYDPYSTIEISSSNNWKDIREWGRRVFNNNDPLNDSLKNICRKIMNGQHSTDDRILTALKFVQNKIRYLGIEVGVNSQKPHSPNKVFEQGFGDCKDKALLLSKMLNEMGVMAYPALLSTTYREHIKDYLPSPLLFNHAVVKVELKNNQSIWLDPTSTNQGGNLKNQYFAPYGDALVLDDKGTGTDSIIANILSHIEIVERFYIVDLDSNTNLRVVTTYYGYDANNIRYTFATSSKKKIQEAYLNFYKNTYSRIDTSTDIEIIDDSIYNNVTVVENYKVKDFWKSEDSLNKNMIESAVYAYDIKNKIDDYRKKYAVRKSPLFLEYPLHLSHTIIFTLPAEWTVKASKQLIDNEFFRFSFQLNYADRVLTLHYDFETKKDYVQAGKSSEFIADIEKVKNVMYFQLSKNKSTLSHSGKINGLRVTLFLFFISFLGYTSFRIYKKYLALSPSGPISDNHDAIGGWVWLPIIGLFLTPLLALYRLITYGYFSDYIWNLASKSHSILLTCSLFYEIMMQSFYILAPLFLLLFAFNYDKRFPKIMVWFYILNISLNIIDMTLVSSILNNLSPHDYKLLVRPLLIACIWIPFFIYSEKCKRIFVR